jgi:hypothetical protein
LKPDRKHLSKLFSPLQTFPGGFSLGRIEVETAEMEQDVGLEAFPVAVTEGLLD